MDFGFTPEQELLRRTARDLLADRAPMARVRQMIADDSGLDDADGGAWPHSVGRDSSCPSSTAAPGSVSSSSRSCSRRWAARSSPVRSSPPRSPHSRSSPAAATRSARAGCRGSATGRRGRHSLSSRRAGRWDPAAVAVRAQSGGEALVLSGTKRFVPEAAGADIIVCAVRRDDGALALVLVEAGARGVTIAPLATMDRTRRVDDVVLDGVRVDAEQVLPCDAATVAARLLDRGRVMLAADMAGGAERVSRDDGRVREGATPVRTRDRQLPGDPAPVRRHVGRGRESESRDVLRRVRRRRGRCRRRARGPRRQRRSPATRTAS